MGYGIADLVIYLNVRWPYFQGWPNTCAKEMYLNQVLFIVFDDAYRCFHLKILMILL